MSLQTTLGRLRRARHMTQRALAKESGLSQRSIAGYETGTAKPELESLVKLADALGVPLDVLVGRAAPPPRVVVNDVAYVPSAESSDPGGRPSANPESFAEGVVQAEERKPSSQQRKGSKRRDPDPDGGAR